MFKRLHRTRIDVFRDDERALTGELKSKIFRISVEDNVHLKLYTDNITSIRTLKRTLTFKYLCFSLKAARLKINEEFKKNKNESSEESIQQV